MDNKNMKAVFTITEHNDRSYWHRIGVGYVNRDGSINIRLDAVPVNGTLHVREWTARDEAQPSQDERKPVGIKKTALRQSESIPTGF